MEGVEVVCVEIQENEDGEIVYVEKVEDSNSTSPEEYCVMECEIATSENFSKSISEEPSSPVEIIVFPNFSEKYSNCVTNGEERKNMKVLKAKNQCDVNLKKTSNLPKDRRRFIDDNKSNEDFDIVLKLAMRSDSDSEESVDHKFEEEKITEETSKVADDTIKLQKSKLWTLLDKQDRRNTSSSKGHVITTSGSLDVRKTYSGVLPKKSCVRDNDDGFSQLPFRCKVCDQCFRQDSSLKIHLKVHAGKYSDSCIIN